METTWLAVDRIYLNKTQGPVKAFVNVKIAGRFVVKNLKVVEGKQGLFVTMPAEKYLDKNQEEHYSPLAFPINKDAHAEVQAVVLEAFTKAQKA
jgi:stage V sporulation protein G